MGNTFLRSFLPFLKNLGREPPPSPPSSNRDDDGAVPGSSGQNNGRQSEGRLPKLKKAKALYYHAAEIRLLGFEPRQPFLRVQDTVKHSYFIYPTEEVSFISFFLRVLVSRNETDGGLSSFRRTLGVRELSLHFSTLCSRRKLSGSQTLSPG